MDPATLSWVLRIRDTEALIRKRREEYQEQRRRNEYLQADLAHVERERACLQLQVAKIEEHRARLRRRTHETGQDLQKRREKLTQTLQLASLRRRRRDVQAQLEALRAATQGDQAQAVRFQALMNQYLDGKAMRCTTLERRQARAEQEAQQLVEGGEQARLDEQVGALGQRLQQLRQQQGKLADEVTGAETGNVLCRGRIEATKHNTAREVERLQALSASLKQQLFNACRQRSVNDVRLKQLQRESAWLHSRQQELDADVERASNAISCVVNT